MGASGAAGCVNLMAAPEIIAVRRTEEEAGYVSFRPVVRQNFPLQELVGMILGVTGKNGPRILKILRSGGISFHSYRYSWQGFEMEEKELDFLLSRFPDADESRAFRPEGCVAIWFETGDRHAHFGGAELQGILEVGRASGSRKRLFGRRTLWEALLSAASSGPLRYEGYSYARQADVYALELNAEQSAWLAAAAEAVAPRELGRKVRAIEKATRMMLACAREDR